MPCYPTYMGLSIQSRKFLKGCTGLWHARNLGVIISSAGGLYNFIKSVQSFLQVTTIRGRQ